MSSAPDSDKILATVHKLCQLIIHSRIVDRQLFQEKQANISLSLPSSRQIQDQLQEFSRHEIGPFSERQFHVNIFVRLPQGPGEQPKEPLLLEQWVVEWPHIHVNLHSKEGRPLYRNMVILCRSVYAFARLLPGHQLYRRLKDFELQLSGTGALQHPPQFQLEYSITSGSFTTAFKQMQDSNLAFHRFEPVPVPGSNSTSGRLAVSVQYRDNVNFVPLDSPVAPRQPVLGVGFHFNDYFGESNPSGSTQGDQSGQQLGDSDGWHAVNPSEVDSSHPPPGPPPATRGPHREGGSGDFQHVSESGVLPSSRGEHQRSFPTPTRPRANTLGSDFHHPSQPGSRPWTLGAQDHTPSDHFVHTGSSGFFPEDSQGYPLPRGTSPMPIQRPLPATAAAQAAQRGSLPPSSGDTESVGSYPLSFMDHGTPPFAPKEFVSPLLGNVTDRGTLDTPLSGSPAIGSGWSPDHPVSSQPRRWPNPPLPLQSTTTTTTPTAQPQLSGFPRDHVVDSRGGGEDFAALPAASVRGGVEEEEEVERMHRSFQTQPAEIHPEPPAAPTAPKPHPLPAPSEISSGTPELRAEEEKAAVATTTPSADFRLPTETAAEDRGDEEGGSRGSSGGVREGVEEVGSNDVAVVIGAFIEDLNDAPDLELPEPEQPPVEDWNSVWEKLAILDRIEPSIRQGLRPL